MAWDRRIKKVWSGATAGCLVSLGVREALEAILQINAQTMKSLGYPKQPLAKFVTASLEMMEPMYQWFLEAWDKVAKDKSGEAVSPTCDNLSDKVQKNRRAWWMKGEYKSTHPPRQEKTTSCCNTLMIMSLPSLAWREKKPHRQEMWH